MTTGHHDELAPTTWSPQPGPAVQWGDYERYTFTVGSGPNRLVVHDWVGSNRAASLQRLERLFIDPPQFAASPPKPRTLIHLACLAALGDAHPALS